MAKKAERSVSKKAAPKTKATKKAKGQDYDEDDGL
jgi:hypothetical protein